jgi:two-component system phosphate regulon sensor histidine kinase PhoR
MRAGIRGRFVLFTLGLLITSAIVFGGYLLSAFGARLSAYTTHDLTVRSALVMERARASVDLRAEAPSLATHLARVAEARVSIIDPSGVVRGDSSVGGSALAGLDSHATRPEVIAALESGAGTSARYSSTIYGQMLYVAHRLDRDDGAWIVRLAYEPVVMNAMVSEMRLRLLYGTLLALAVTAALSLVSARVFTRTIRHLTDVARTMRTDLSKRTHLRGEDDISRLGMELDALASELQRSLADLSQQRERLEAMLEAMQEGVMVTGEDGAIIVANRALRRMLLASEVTGKQPIEVLRNADLHELLTESMRTRRHVTRELEFGSIRRRRVRVQVSPLAGGRSGRARGGLVAVFFDVTDLRRLETLRRDFVANVSHELRTPVASIRATSETLRGGALKDPETAAEFVDIIDRNAQRLHRLVEDLLDLSKIEAKELDLKLEGLSARAEAKAAVDLLRQGAEQRSTELKVDAPEGLRVRADARALGQILTNLIDNAIKYCPQGAHIAVRARGLGDRVIFEVEDDGPGIDATHVPRLFERFYRVDTGRSRALGGTGLGLAIVKHLAEALGGQVSVESTLGQGSTFRVDLPAASDSAGGPRSRTPVPAPSVP